MLTPELPECARDIPAMTTEQERLAYYRLTREAVERGGEIIELGAWLGASTACIAAAVRDGGGSFVHVYDRFVSKAAHIAKQQKWYGDRKQVEPIQGPTVETFQANMGPLNDFIVTHHGEIKDMHWLDEPIALLISDAPKRVPEISHVLMEFAGALNTGSIMAWQDFGHFASYDIPACLYRLGGYVEFVEFVYPGTTAVFRIVKPWKADKVTRSALRIQNWTADEIETVWAGWVEKLPRPARPRFACGAVMFLSDIGHGNRAIEILRGLIANHAEEIVPKWQYFRANRPDFVERYHRLFSEIP